MNKLIRGNFEADVTHNFIKLNGIEFTPNEGDKLTELLGSAGKMSSLPVLPKNIANGPFTVAFGEDFQTLTRDGVNVEFKFNEIDNLIQLVQDCVAKQLDLIRLSPQTRGDGYVAPARGEVFEGRD